MEGKVYYRIKTPNGFLDTHYETIEEAQKNLENFKKENGDTEPLHMTRVIEFEEELYSDDFIGDNYDTLYIQPANITQEDYEEEKSLLEQNIENCQEANETWQTDYGNLAIYAISLENRKLWDIIKAKIFGDKKPDNYEHFELDSYKYNPAK